MLEEAALRATLLRMCSSSEIRDPDINLTALQCIELLVIEEKESDDQSLRGFIGTQGYFGVFSFAVGLKYKYNRMILQLSAGF